MEKRLLAENTRELKRSIPLPLRFIQRISGVVTSSNYGDEPTYIGPTGQDFDNASD